MKTISLFLLKYENICENLFKVLSSTMSNHVHQFHMLNNFRNKRGEEFKRELKDTTKEIFDL